MFAGLNVFFSMVMVLSDTEVVREGVVTAVRVVVRSVEGVNVAVVTGTVGCAGGDSEHPQVRRSSKAMRRSTGIDLIDAGLSFPYNKMMDYLIARASYTCVTVPAGPVLGGIIQEIVDEPRIFRKSSPR